MAFVYILRSESKDKYYIGATNDLGNRLNEHNAGESKWTKHGKPWTLVLSKEYKTYSEARKKEAYIKKMKSRIYIEKLIKIGIIS